MPADSNSPRGNHFGPSRQPNPSNRNQPVDPYSTAAFMRAGTSRSTGNGAAAGSAPRSSHTRSAQVRGAQASPRQAASRTVQPVGARPNSAYNVPPKKKGKGKIVAAVIGVIVLVILAFAGTTGFFLYRDAKDMMALSQTMMDEAKSLKDDLKEGNGESLKATAGTITSQISTLKEKVNGPAWTVASFIPVYGQDVTLARNLLDQADNLANNALVPACDSLANFKLSELMQDGAINIDLLNSVISTMQTVEPVISQSADEINKLPEAHIGKVNELVAKVKDPMTSAVGLLQKFNQIAPMLPQMLGAGGQTRNYIIAAENTAEIRATGGFAGSAGVMSITDGRISLGEFEGVQQVPGRTNRIQITDEEMKLFQPYEPTMDFTSGDSFFTPDFPRGSQLISTLWSVNHGNQHIDGVIALDPTFLQYLLQLTGGVTAVDGTAVDGTNAAQVLLSSTYWKYPSHSKSDTAMQDTVFASVASAAFDKLLGGLGDVGITDLFKVIQRGGEEGRLLIYMENPDEENAMKEMGFDGALPTDPSKPETGVYVNNYSYSKLDWYLNMTTQKSEKVMNADGTASYNLTVTLTNSMSAEDAANLPAYVAAHNGGADNPAQEMLRFYLYAPMGGSISNIQGGSLSEATHNGLQVFYTDVRLNPGESYSVTYTVTVPAEGANADLVVRATPTAQAAREGTASNVLAEE